MAANDHVQAVRHWPALNVADARKEALKIAGRIAADRIEPGKRSAAKFADAMDEYLAHLVRQSERRGKPARWAGNVRSLSRLYLIPQWGKWPLAEMSGSPAAVRDWHIQVTKDAGPTTANRCVQTMRAATSMPQNSIDPCQSHFRLPLSS